LEYLLIRLITVFDPALWPGLFFASFSWRGFRLMKTVYCLMARMVAKDHRQKKVDPAL
jgi:hypothetical protein